MDNKMNLRQKAKAEWEKKLISSPLNTSQSEMEKLVHELSLFQLELEMQNDELVLAKDASEAVKKKLEVANQKYAEVAEAANIKAEAAMDKYKELYDFAPSGYFTLSMDGNIRDINLRAARMIDKMLANKVDFCPVPIVTKSGVQIPVETRVSPVTWDGEPVLFGVTKDISKITLSEEKFSKIFRFNPSPCGLSSLDDHKYIKLNEAFHALLGFDKDEVIGKTAKDLGILTPETIREALIKADCNGNVTNIGASLKAKNGDIKHVLLSSENIYIQDKKYRFTFVQDITERKRAEDALIESEARFRNLL